MVHACFNHITHKFSRLLRPWKAFASSSTILLFPSVLRRPVLSRARSIMHTCASIVRHASKQGDSCVCFEMSYKSASLCQELNCSEQTSTCTHIFIILNPKHKWLCCNHYSQTFHVCHAAEDDTWNLGEVLPTAIMFTRITLVASCHLWWLIVFYYV